MIKETVKLRYLCDSPQLAVFIKPFKTVPVKIIYAYCPNVLAQGRMSHIVIGKRWE